MAFGDLVRTAKNTGNDATSAAGVTATFSGTPTPGNLITVHVVGIVASLTFTTDLASALNLAGVADAGSSMDGFYKVAGASEPTAIKVFPSATTDMSVIICEWEGPFASSPLDVESTPTSSVSTNVTTQNTGTSPTTAQADELAVGAIAVGLHLTDITGWTNSFTEANEQQGPATSNRATIAVARRVLTATGTYSSTVTHGSGRSKGMLATFKRAVTGVTGDIASTLDPVTLAAAGSTVGGRVGTIASTLADVTLAASGTVDNPTWPGGLPQASIIGLWDARTLAGSAGAAVSAWPDSGPVPQSNLAMATGTQQPVLNDSGFGGIRAVQFDGSNDRLDVTLDQTYSDDFAFIIVMELLTYPAGTAGVFMSTGGIPNKHILGVDDVEDPPGWVVMSSNDGTQAQHHHGTASQSYLEAVPSRFIMTQLVRNDGEHKLWENNSLVINLTDSSGENSDLNNLNALKIGAREDNSRFVNGRVALVLLVDMTETDEATLLDARDELAVEFAVPGFASSHSGTIASTLGSVTLVASGEVRQVESGGAEATVTTPAEGSGRKVGLGGGQVAVATPVTGAGLRVGIGSSQAVVVTPVTGAGKKLGTGGGQVAVATPVTGAGKKLGTGGGQVAVAVVVTGAGGPIATGGATATVTTPATGAGRKLATGSGQATVATPVTGGGKKLALGSGQTTVVVVSTGAGGSFENPSSGSLSTVEVSTQGAGKKLSSAGAGVTVAVAAEGTGFSLNSGGSTALAGVVVMGAGRPRSFGGADAIVVVVGIGGGGGGETPTGGSTAIVPVVATGAGGVTFIPSGGSTATVAVLATGGAGRKVVRGGGLAVVVALAAGGGVGTGPTAIIMVTVEGAGHAVRSGGTTAIVSVRVFGGFSAPDREKYALYSFDRVYARELREGHGWSRADLAQRAHIPEVAIFDFETGINTPTLRQGARLAAALGVPQDTIQNYETHPVSVGD